LKGRILVSHLVSKEGDMMKPLILASILVLSGASALLVAPTESLASLAYTRVSVEAVDIATPSLTFKTSEGQVWTLQATSAELLKGLQRGDTCSVEIDLENRVTKIVKVDPTSP
jgi:hypothetical protein